MVGPFDGEIFDDEIFDVGDDDEAQAEAPQVRGGAMLAREVVDLKVRNAALLLVMAA